MIKKKRFFFQRFWQVTKNYIKLLDFSINCISFDWSINELCTSSVANTNNFDVEFLAKITKEEEEQTKINQVLHQWSRIVETKIISEPDLLVWKQEVCARIQLYFIKLLKIHKLNDQYKLKSCKTQLIHIPVESCQNKNSKVK